MLRSLLFVSLLVVASEARRCYSCTSAADCASVGVGRVQECDSRTQCYTVSINGRAQLKGCTLECAQVERHSELHACHTCSGDLCNNSPSVVGHNNQDHHHRRHNRREARRHNENNNNNNNNIGSGASVGGGTGIGVGASPHNNNGNSGIGNGASIGGHGSGGIGSGASVGGNTGIGGGVAPSGSNRRHYKRTIGHGAGYDSSIGGGAAPMGGGAYPSGGWNSGSGGIGGGAMPESYPSQRNSGSQWNDDPWNSNQQGYNGIGSGARPYNSASLSSSLAALVAPLALFVFRR
uniref:Uncharacterized protein n=1 Tax=Pristionchus pacificus TaxID=54126 RepID=A0A8R1YDU5_PRIPA